MKTTPLLGLAYLETTDPVEKMAEQTKIVAENIEAAMTTDERFRGPAGPPGEPGLPGPEGVPTDQAVAAYVANSTASTNAAVKSLTASALTELLGTPAWVDITPGTGYTATVLRAAVLIPGVLAVLQFRNLARGTTGTSSAGLMPENMRPKSQEVNFLSWPEAGSTAITGNSSWITTGGTIGMSGAASTAYRAAAVLIPLF